ncbi:2-C-methyl-D-erythritol 2,4-cyclodiphosphate synthase [Clostridium sporogenes]|uniref:2-C-methyl-D-erythritol 2,4-cyclodiphosphate synthase n=1 Tax=Clostridium botulinum TaxID=1491 RepID=A0A6M0SYL7_CLOBO|nr:2-C-methyl-D-erythritol 2,4-cyclodiphosphate synthase [Clostridium sporogenes]NFA60596.1 2-C-methyl-D-erythritol 2,4-cyclodiphosphate synthase [Clostridium botulinum]NFI74234.1 2-C-methyl-D-erythritol 2,4-cyclodiphosphate synthase [Clostridium sporogenes]NFL72308.1 2-C-methyl-D-erythritol 2,4-cyclodiphosphate synthase [Clostridium sporogenes]NFM26186.1 2-C-methyl-D-erythritol 2,4-cyclodiphosphate synthase [Clostridium sporogenes]NFP62108.1 2-C-methyl-D-erythritol 2,4-cyclodiphosphate syntha
MRIGFGYDVHKLVENRPLIIGGITIPHNKGLLGHSDADVLVHSIMDALLGAAALGDIGKHFPDSDKNFKNISSLLLLSKVKSLINKEGYEIINIDCTIMAQKPKMLPYIEDMRKNICKCLNLNDKMLNIKATTEEGLGFTGKEEGISANAICLLN